MEYKLLGESVQVKELNETIKQVAPANISVLITGESGTGKEVVANALYHFSKRKHKPFVKVNCGAIPEGIIESELFGHQKGAFTGATDSRMGYFEMADNGTIFLDEIGEMPLGTQVKILRVLESGEFMKVGGNETIKVDVRVIAATNRNLSNEVMNKNFREDLYFRLKSINLHIPPLRERKEDIELLFNNFIKNFCRENNITFQGIDEDAMEYVKNFVWNGNARELKNFCESIVVLIPGRKLNSTDIKKHLSGEPEHNSSLPALSAGFKDQQFDRDLIMRALFEIKTDIMNLKNSVQNINIENVSYDLDRDFYIPKEIINNMTYDEIDKEILVYLLRTNKWNIQKVAESLKQTTRNIYRKVKLYNISKD